MTWLLAIGQWFLKLLLGGLYGQELQQAQDQAEQSAEAGIEHAHSTVEASQTEVEIFQAQQAAKEKIDALPKKPDDPFNSGDWNEST